MELSPNYATEGGADLKINDERQKKLKGEKRKKNISKLRGGVKNPRHGNFPLGGYPPPGASMDENFPKS